MPTETVSFNWEEFTGNICEKLDENFLFSNFTDVTLVSDDDKQLKAHKFILSSCSPVFWNILAHNPHQHPLIYLTDVKHEEVRSLIKFMYLGQTEVVQDDFEHFMKLARRFQIKGLTQNEVQEALVHDDSKQETKVGVSEEIANENHDMEVKEKSIVDKKNENFDLHSEFIYYCKECNFKASCKKELKQHIETQHFVPWFKCNDCEFQSRRSGSLKVHKENRHQGLSS